LKASLKDANYFTKSTESHNTSTTINTATQLKYITKKRDVAYVSHLATTIRTATFKTNL